MPVSWGRLTEIPRRAVVLATVAALLPVGLLAVTSVAVASSQVTAEVNRRVTATAALSSVFVGEQTTGLKALVHSYAIRPTLQGDITAGRAGAGAVQAQLASLAGSGGGVSGAFATDRAGTSIGVYPAARGVVGRNFAYRDWYRGLAIHGGPYVSVGYRTALAGHPLVVAVADYVRGPSGVPVGIIAAIFTVDAIQSFSTHIAEAQGVSLLVTDRAGTLLSAGGHHGLLSAATDPRVRAALAGRSGLADYTPHLPGGRSGERELSAYVPVAGTGWTVTASVPYRVAFAGLTRLRTTVAAITALLVAVILGGATLVARADRHRRDADDRVRRRDAQLAAVLASTDEAFASTDPTGVVTAWSTRAETLFGWPAADIVGRSLADTVLPRVPRITHLDGMIHDDGKTSDDGETSDDGPTADEGVAPESPGADCPTVGKRVEVTARHRDGRVFPVELSVWAHEDGSGFSSFMHDITERVSAQAQLAAARDEALTASRAKAALLVEMTAAKELFSSAFDNAPTGVALVGLDGRFRRVNRTMCDITGYTEVQLLTRTFSDITPVEDHAQDAAAVAGLLAGDTDHLAFEKRYLRADGSTVWVAVRSTLAADADGRPDHRITHVTDITERRAATAAMAEANASLAAARDVAVASTAAKSAFLSTMSHEIRTPMNAVIAMTGLLLDTELDPVQREFTETVRTSGDALLVIINDILDFSKIEAGDLELEQAPFGLRDAVEGALALVALAAADRHLELVAELTEDCPEMVVGDVTRFRQVIVNLLSNAVKFTPAGEIHVLVGAQRLTAADDGPVRLTVAVRDTGIGVPADRLDRLFQPFSQVDSSTTRLYGGTGIGLVISRRLAVAMGGDLQVRSEPGVGSTFTFTALLTGAPDRRAARETEPVRTLAGRSILVVDDNATNRRVLSGLLHRWGVTATEAADPAAALRLVADGRRFDAAVLDMHMPGMDGAQLAAELRTTAAGANLPLLLLSSLQCRLPAAQRALFVSTLTKPARADVLHDALLAALQPAAAALHAIETAGGRRATDGAGLSFDADGAAVSLDAVGAPVVGNPVGAAVPRDTDRPPLTAAVAGDTATRKTVTTSAEVGSAEGRRPLRVLLAEDNIVNQKVARLMLAKLGHRVDVVANGLEAVDAVRLGAYDVVLMDVQMPELDGLQATRMIRGELPTDRQPPIVAVTANVQLEDSRGVHRRRDGRLPVQTCPTHRPRRRPGHPARRDVRTGPDVGRSHGRATVGLRGPDPPRSDGPHSSAHHGDDRGSVTG